MSPLLEAVERVAERFDPTPDPYVTDPVLWVGDRLGGFLWSKQREIAESVASNRYTAVRSAHSTGKSYLAARLAAWWIDSHPIGEAFVVTTAPTAPQVEAILWREINRAHRDGDLEGYITSGAVPQWKVGGEIVAYGRKPADYDQAAFQGIHARYVLVIMDEAGGIPRSLYDAVDSLATNEHARVLAIGNPDDPASEFERVCRPGSGWNVIGVSAFDTPAFTEERFEVPDDLLELLVSEMWVAERAKRWGSESPVYISKVIGEFPEVSDDTLISPSLIRAAISRELPGIDTGRFGADVARYGRDETVVYRNRGGVIRRVYRASKQDTMETAGAFGRLVSDLRNEVPMFVDVIGVGAGVFDRMREQAHEVYPFNSSERAYEPDRYKNRRAESYWALREAFEDGLVDLDLEDEDLQAQLTAIKWKVDSSGRTQIEAKEDMVKRGFPSPDRADAVMMSNVAPPDMSPFEDAEREPVAGLTDDLLGRPM